MYMLEIKKSFSLRIVLYVLYLPYPPILKMKEIFFSAGDIVDSRGIFLQEFLKAFLPEIFRGLLDISGGKVFCKSTNPSP